MFYDGPAPAELRGIDAYRESWREFLGWVSRFGPERLEVHAADTADF